VIATAGSLLWPLVILLHPPFLHREITIVFKPSQVRLLLVLPSLSTSLRVDILPEPIFPWNHAFALCSAHMF
jgi:hypothetical protein